MTGGWHDDPVDMMMWLTWRCECEPSPSSGTRKFSHLTSFDYDALRHGYWVLKSCWIPLQKHACFNAKSCLSMTTGWFAGHTWMTWPDGFVQEKAIPIFTWTSVCVCVYVTKGYFDTKKQCDVFKYILLQNRSHWIPIKCLAHRPISGSKPLQPAVSSECSRATDDPWPWWSDRCCSLEPSLHWIRVQRDSTDLGVCPCLGYRSMGENPDAPLKIKLARKWTFIRPNIVFECIWDFDPSQYCIICWENHLYMKTNGILLGFKWDVSPTQHDIWVCLKIRPLLYPPNHHKQMGKMMMNHWIWGNLVSDKSIWWWIERNGVEWNELNWMEWNELIDERTNAIHG